MRIPHGGGDYRGHQGGRNWGQPEVAAAEIVKPAETPPSTETPALDRGNWGRGNRENPGGGPRGGRRGRWGRGADNGPETPNPIQTNQNIKTLTNNASGAKPSPFTLDKPEIIPPETPPVIEEAPPPVTESSVASGDIVNMYGGGPNRIVLGNKSNKPIKVALLKNPTHDAPVQQPQFVELAPGQTVNTALPTGWAGRVYKQTGDGSKVTLSELTFDGSGGQLFYDSSVIDGYNGPVTMTPTNAKSSGNGLPVTVGSREDITSKAPASMIIKNADGTTSLDGVAPVGDNASKPANQQFYINALGRGTAYTYPKDDVASTRIVKDNSMNIDFF